MASLVLARGLLAGALLAAVAFFGAPSTALAHGGVKLEHDECVLRVGPNVMHFIAYQRVGEDIEYCEDIGATGPTVIGLTAVSPALRDMAIGVRIVKDSSEETIVDIAPKVYRNGAMTFEYNFKEKGHYVGLVTARDALGHEWTARFPFSVGLYTFWGMIEYILYAVGFVSLVGLLWFVLRAKSSKAPQTGDAIA